MAQSDFKPLEGRQSELGRRQTFQNVRKALELSLDQSQPSTPAYQQALTPRKSWFGKADHTVPKYPSHEIKNFFDQLFKRTQGRDLVRLQTFQDVLQIKGDDLAERLFTAMDKDATGYVTSEQLVNSLLSLKYGTLEDRVAFIWSFVAKNEDSISRKELQLLLKASCSEGDLSIDEIAVEALAGAFFARAGKPDADRLLLEDFSSVLKQRSELRSSLEIGGFRNLADRGAEELAQDVSPLSWYERAWSKTLLKLKIENFQLTLWMTLMVLAQLGGFAAGFVKNDEGPIFSVLGWSLSVAKGSAQAIQVVLIIFPFTMARNLLTYLRLTPLHYLIPFNEHIDVHRKLAGHFFFWSAVHTICHIINGERIADPSRRHDVPFKTIPFETTDDWYSQEVSITGVLMMGIMIIGYLFAVNWPGRKRFAQQRFTAWLKSFELFYYTHILMALSVLVLLIIHPYPGPVVNPRPHRGTTWAYLAGGTIVYLLERVCRKLRQLFWQTDIIGVKLHEGGVVELRLQRPRVRGAFDFDTFPGKAGQYCFLNIPVLAKYEWHPFSLTSGSRDDFISFHIRSVGDWTNALHSYCKQNLVKDVTEPAEMKVDATGQLTPAAPLCLLANRLDISVDGPFGAPAQDYSRFDCLLLVGAGIGITPFASILRNLLDEYNSALCQCCKTVNERLFAPKKVYFVWTSREQSAPQFFKDTLAHIHALDENNFFEISIYLTRVMPQSDLRVTIAKVAQMIQHEANGFDAVSSTYQPVPCYFGRPSWPALFEKINKNHAGSKVGVFVCGPPALSSQLKGVCTTYNQKRRKEKQRLTEDKPCQFHFHKENF